MGQKDNPSAALVAGVAASAVMIVVCSVGGLLSWMKAPSGTEGSNKSADAAQVAPSTSATTLPDPARAPKSMAIPTNGKSDPPVPPNGIVAGKAANSNRATAQSGATGGAAILARMRAQKAAAAKAAKEKNEEDASKPVVTFLFASQTGTSEEIARSLHDEAVSRKHRSQCMSLNDWASPGISPATTPIVITIASTTGDGDSPDNAGKGLLALKRRSEALTGMKYTVMGLGDSNYTNFMKIPRTVQRLMRKHGAEEFYPCKEADEVDGLDDIVDAWRDDLWAALDAAMATKEHKAEEVHTKGQKACDLPEDFTVKGHLLDADADIQGLPAPRLSKCNVVLASAGSCEPVDLNQPTASEKARRDAEGRYSEAEPFWARVSENRLMTHKECPKRVLHISLDVASAGMSFQPGDAVGLRPSNEPHIVDKLLSTLSADGSQCIKDVQWTDSTATGEALPHLRRGCTVRQALLWSCDLTTPPAKFALAALATCASDPREAATLRYLSSKDGRAAYKADIAAGRPTLLQLLQRFASCKPGVPALLEMLPPLRPRMYSLTNSQAVTPDRLEFAFHVVGYNTHWGTHGGVATTWLERECREAAWCAVHLRPPTGFRPPEDASVPIIMIGPGTGVAPFRGFLQQRRAALEAGNTIGTSWLFFGNWKREWDFLYEEELQGFAADGTLTHLHLAWSRETDKKVYVQDLMKEVGAELCSALLEDGACVFVCGDGAQMAKDVHHCLENILVQHGACESSSAADSFMKDLATQKRYLKDVWL
eukprot:jgi/Ulvmu1/7279/UM035_0067.1